MPDAIVAFLIRSVGAAVTFALQVALARMMTPDGYGHFAVVWSWLLALGGMASLGLNDLSLRLLPRHGLRRRKIAPRRFAATGLRTTAFAAVAGCIIVVIAAFLLPLTFEARMIIVGIGLALPFLAMEFFLGSIARAMGWQTLGIGTVFILRPALIIAMCSALWWRGFELGGGLVSLVLAVGLFVSTLFLFVATFQRLGWPNRVMDMRHALRWVRIALPAWFASGLDDLLAYADVVLVGLLLSPAAAGIYFAGNRVLTPAALVQYAFFYVTPRQFSQSIAARDGAGLSQHFLRATFQTVIATVLSVVVVLLAAPLLLLFFGETYRQALPLLPILALAQIARALGGQAQELLLVAGRNGQLAVVNGATIVLLLFAMLLLVPAHAMMGAAIAMAGAMLARSAGFLWLAVATPKFRKAAAA